MAVMKTMKTDACVDMGRGPLFTAHMSASWRFSKMLKIDLVYGPVILLLGIYARDSILAVSGFLLL